MQTLTTKPRVQSIDLLRGLVMIIMALDHTRDFFHWDTAVGHDPLDFVTTSPILFLTRWITHFCAPVFVFLSGTSIFFVSQRKTKKELSFFLLTRGLWLIFLELTIIYFSWQNNFHYYLLILQVIWTIGLSMVLLSAFIWLPRKVLFALGVLIVLGHNELDRFRTITDTLGGEIWSVLHVPHIFFFPGNHKVLVLYPVLPWFGLMMLGFWFGELYRKDYPAEKRRKALLWLGFGAVLLFVLLRTGNFYGDAKLWQQQSNTIYTILSFVNTTKYPPSLLYILMTIGPAMLFLAFMEGIQNRITNIVTVYGRVPLFYYILHFYLLHLTLWILFFATGHTTAELDFENRFAGIPQSFGFHLWQVYIIWITVVAVLYFPCRWYDKYKSTHRQWWLSYL